MFVFIPLSEPTRRALIEGGLDPDDVAGIVRNPRHRGPDGRRRRHLLFRDELRSITAGRGHLWRPSAGVIADCRSWLQSSRPSAAMQASDFHATVTDGTWVAPGTPIADVTAPTRLLLITAERTTLNLLCHLWAWRPGRATRPTRWRARRPRSATPARARPLRCESTRCGAAAVRTTGWGCPTWHSSRTTTWLQPAV